MSYGTPNVCIFQTKSPFNYAIKNLWTNSLFFINFYNIRLHHSSCVCSVNRKSKKKHKRKRTKIVKKMQENLMDDDYEQTC